MPVREVMIDGDLADRAEIVADALGISLEHYIMLCVEQRTDDILSAVTVARALDEDVEIEVADGDN